MACKKSRNKLYDIRNDESVRFCAAAGCACADSIPGRDEASFLKRALILKPALALLSINMMPSFAALSSPSSTDTCRRSERSVLFPTKTIMTSLPRSLRTSSIHFEVFRNDARSVSKSLIKCSGNRNSKQRINCNNSVFTCYIIDYNSYRRVADI